MRRSGVRAHVFGVKVQVLQLESRPALSGGLPTATPEGRNTLALNKPFGWPAERPQTHKRRESALQVGIEHGLYILPRVHPLETILPVRKPGDTADDSI